MFTKRENEEILEKHLEVKTKNAAVSTSLIGRVQHSKTKIEICTILAVSTRYNDTWTLQKTVLPSGKANFDNLLSHAEASLMNL